MDLGLPASLSVTALVVGEDPLARENVARLFASSPAMAVQAVLGPDELTDALLEDAHVVVWDVGLSGEDGLQKLSVAAELTRPVIALVADERAAFNAQLAGAKGLLRRTVSAEVLAAAARAVAVGLTVVDEGFSAAVPGVRVASPERTERLTAREEQVLFELSKGSSNKEIASALNISDHTAKFHVNSVMQKLGVQNRTEAVVRAVRLGLLML